MIRAASLVLFVLAVVGADKPAPKLQMKQTDPNSFALFRIGQDKPLLIQAAPGDGRPYIHPIVAPDGKGVLTELSPDHHKHQTGLYVGILKVNDRDYFHNRGGDYFNRKGAGGMAQGTKAFWRVEYDWLDKERKIVFTETQEWNFADHGSFYVLDLAWSALAAVDVTCEKYDYGGLFLRMPWKNETGGEAINSEGKKNGDAEGQRARWVDVGVPIEGRTDAGHIAILDHKGNPGHPIPWRIDGQLGFGPAPSRLGDWKIAKGETAKAKYRLVIYTGKTNTDRIEVQWKDFTK